MNDAHTTMECRDDLGFKIALSQTPGRVVCLVPSLTETLFALGLDSEVVGVTQLCVEPAAAVQSRPKVGSPRNPDLRALAGLKPDLVIANAEVNRREDIERLRSGGISVYVTYPRTVPGAVQSLLELGLILGRRAASDALARKITQAVSVIEATLGAWSKLRLRAFCPISKKPWTAFNADTYAHDVLRLMGYNNIFADSGERYPRTTLAEIIERRPDVVLLPDEPYGFTAGDMNDLKLELPPALARRMILIGGRDLHWYGAHMRNGLPALAERLNRLRAAVL